MAAPGPSGSRPWRRTVRASLAWTDPDPSTVLLADAGANAHLPEVTCDDTINETTTPQ